MESAEYYRPNRAQVPEHPIRKDETSVDNDARVPGENLSRLFRSDPGKGQRPRQRVEPRPKPKPRTELSILKKHIKDIK